MAFGGLKHFTNIRVEVSGPRTNQIDCNFWGKGHRNLVFWLL